MADRSQRAVLMIPEEVLVYAATKYLEMNAALPEDAQLHSVHFDIRYLGWAVALTSEAFEPIPDHIEAPILNDLLRQRPPRYYDDDPSQPAS